ncbi:MAG: ABC transporter substrate-binding protein [Deltaproteobacteria bacterium]|nr:ABC transporter substrate-binding protein [Deltaproteobacteria bacterium]MBW1847914.1 ABC transporter substrate-binding protein [Deltaproteobacteria bacterium]MBW2179143.1 ABC transporter substrate-binding protein [Deltaproteobacteria bacterium]MBW2365347.1 ABC transporter substrate-binding protein [Deltaproteobacteria bacterium]
MHVSFSCKTFSSLIFFLIFAATAVFAGADDVVTVAIEYDLGTVNTLETKTGTDLILTHMHEQLISSDPVTGEEMPNFAETIKVMPNGKDIKIRLRKGHLFHTGDPVTAHDVKWTYEQAVAPENAHLYAGMVDEIEDIEVIDNHTIVFHFYEKYAPWRSVMGIGICSKKYFEKVGRDVFRTQPVGSGPFRFVSRDIGNNLILEAYDGYTYREHIYNPARTKIVKPNALKKKVDFKKLRLLSIPDSVTRFAMLEAGEVDLIYNILPQHVKRLEAKGNIKVKKSSKVPSFFAMAISPVQYPIMKDVKFVTGINYAINRQEIIDRIYLGEGYPLYMYAGKTELGYDPTVKFEFNSDKARKLIKESTYKPEEVIIITYNSGVPNSRLVAEILQKYLNDVGIQIKIQEIEYGTFSTYVRNRDKRVGHMAMYAWHGARDPHMRIVLTQPGDSIYSTNPDRPNQGKLDKLILAQSMETNEKKRLVILKKIHIILNEEPSSISLFGLNQIYAMNDRIDYTWPTGSGYIINMHQIKIVK